VQRFLRIAILVAALAALVMCYLAIWLGDIRWLGTAVVTMIAGLVFSIFSIFDGSTR
jgi:hypothetical protein